MAGRQLVQCLLWVADNQPDDAQIPMPSAYALLPKVFEGGRRGKGLLKFFQQRHIQILDDDNVSRLIGEIEKFHIVEILLDGRPSVALFPLYVATPSACGGLVKDLLGLTTVRVNNGSFYQSTLFAIDEHNSDVLGRVVSSRPDIPVTYGPEFSGSLLHMAAGLGLVGLAELVLDHGADIERKTNDFLGETPLHVAVQADKSAVVRLLADRGADLNVRCERGLAPLDRAQHADVAELLLRNGARVDCANNRNVPPLFHLLGPLNSCTDHNQLAIVKLFLHYGAGLEMVDSRGRTTHALDEALKLGPYYEEFACILENRFVRPTILRQIKQFKFPDLNLMNDPNSSFLRVFVHHVVKVVSLYPSNVFDTTLDKLWCDDERTRVEYQDDCETEIAISLMTTPIPDTHLSVHDILVRNDRQVARVLRNDSVARMTATEDWTARFPIYGRILSYLLERGQLRRRFQDEGRKNFDSLSGVLKNLPDGLKENILDFLVIEDFINLRKACSRPVISRD